MIRRATWKLSKRPGSYGKQREQVHPPAKQWSEIPNDQANLFLLAKAIITRFYRLNDKTEVTVYAYGSRVNGNFVSASDIDLGVNCENHKSEIFYRPLHIKSPQGEIRIDVKLIQPDPTITYIEIP